MKERDELGDEDTWLASRAPRDVSASAEPRGLVDETRRLGRYVVLDSLGRGGMGVVLRAYDRELDRPVALKVLHRGLDERHARRLRREAQAMAKLSHPHVVQVYEIGEVEGQTFVAMELVKGTTLREWMQQQPRPGWRACVQVFVALGAGLAAAHEQGLVHRDFKPGNAIIDEKGRPRVLDFGLARRDDEVDEALRTIQEVPTDAHEAVALETSLTETGAVLGTPAYMPPEQMSGGEADARSDQFSFCVALYEAVYGERPYEGSSMMALLVSMRSGSVRPTPKGSDVPAALRKLLLRGLALDPAERWPSMETLLERLQRLVAPRRGRWLALGVAVGLLGLGGGLGVTQAMEWLTRCSGARGQLEGVWDEARRQELRAAILGTALSYTPGTWERVEPRLDEYAEAWAAGHTEACEATRVRNEQSEEDMSLRMGCLLERRLHLRATVDELSRADATVVQNAVRAVTSLPGLERCADVEALRAEVPPPEDPAVEEQVAALDEQLVVAQAQWVVGRYEEGLRLSDAVVEEAATLGYEPLMARAWLRQGVLRDQLGDYEGAVSVLRRAYGAALARRMTTEAAEASARLVQVLGGRLARHDEGRGWAEHAEPMSRAAGADMARALYFDGVALTAKSQGKHDEARGWYERALAIREEAVGTDHLTVAAALNGLGAVAEAQREYDDARGYFERALVIIEKELGPEHPMVAAALTNLGTVVTAQGKHDDARGYLERALAIYENGLGREHPDAAALLNSLGTLADLQGRYQEARELYGRALAIYEKELGPDHPNVAGLLTNLGIVVQLQGEHEEARGYYARALEVYEKALGPEHLSLVHPLNGLADVAGLQGRHEDALQLYERALGIHEKALGAEHPEVVHVLTSVGTTLLDLGRPSDALGPLERALTIRTDREVDPALLAARRFALARALWAAPASEGGDRSRAHTLAEQARDAYGTLGEARKTELAEVQGWLAVHRLP